MGCKVIYPHSMMFSDIWIDNVKLIKMDYISVLGVELNCTERLSS